MKYILLKSHIFALYVVGAQLVFTTRTNLMGPADKICKHMTPNKGHLNKIKDFKPRSII